MTPDQINEKHGKPVWKCFGCQAESGLHWWNGLSVAVCRKTECHNAYRDFISAEIEAAKAFDSYVREYYGDANG